MTALVPMGPHRRRKGDGPDRLPADAPPASELFYLADDISFDEAAGHEPDCEEVAEACATARLESIRIFHSARNRRLAPSVRADLVAHGMTFKEAADALDALVNL